MRPNYKFHAIAIAIISLIIVVLYILIGPKPRDAAKAPKGDRAVAIYSASWGENCNASLAEAQLEQQSAPVEKDANGTVIAKPKLVPIKHDNVLTALSSACDGLETCPIEATSFKLGVEPLASCFKRLKISYRCFSYDRLWNVDLGQGETATIDCHATPAAPTK